MRANFCDPESRIHFKPRKCLPPFRIFAYGKKISLLKLHAYGCDKLKGLEIEVQDCGGAVGQFVDQLVDECLKRFKDADEYRMNPCNRSWKNE